jgi:hypothetical protein
MQQMYCLGDAEYNSKYIVQSKGSKQPPFHRIETKTAILSTLISKIKLSRDVDYEVENRTGWSGQILKKILGMKPKR